MKKSLFNKILFYLSVPVCVACKKKLSFGERALCPGCMKAFELEKRRKCSVCFNELPYCSCVNKHLDSRFIHKLNKIFRYAHAANGKEILPANELIYNIKRDKRRDLIDLLSEEVSAAIFRSLKKHDAESYIMTSVPRQRSRVVKYGFDHAESIARAISDRLGIKYKRLLKSKAKQAQKKTHGEERLENAKFLPLKEVDLRGKRIILFDDVVTTGASMGECAMQLKALGAKEIIGAAVAIAFKDKYVPFKNSDYKNNR